MIGEEVDHHTQNQPVSASFVEQSYTQLLNRNINSVEDLEQLILDYSKLDEVVLEDSGWRYIKMTLNTSGEAEKSAYLEYVNEIQPVYSKLSNEVNLKIYQSGYYSQIPHDKFFIYKRNLEGSIKIYREENIPLFSKVQTLEQEYADINAAMTIHYKDEELTLQQTAPLLKSTDRSIRKEVYDLVTQRRLTDAEKLDNLFDELLKLRHQIALNAGFKNFRDYMFAALGRYDYTPEDCFRFHNAIKKSIKPLLDKSLIERKEKLGLEVLKPYDLEVDIDGKSPLKPYDNTEELIARSINCFNRLDSDFGDALLLLQKMNRLDLDSRKGKAPGGYNYPLYQSGVPFIFMNSAGTFRDMITLLHEVGHAVHSLYTAHYQLVDNKSLPSEVAELASMTMELITIDFWDEFFKNEDDRKRAIDQHLNSTLKSLIWICIVDAFQHWIYENPTHTRQQRADKWNALIAEFDSNIVDYSGYEESKTYSWQKQLHIYEVPFYYIEYGFAQLGALAIYSIYNENPKKAIEGYKRALKLGYTKTIPEIYKAANISFDFSENYVQEIVNSVLKQLEKLH